MSYGVTRYSLFSPGSQSWKTSSSGVFKSAEEYMGYLFSERRLELREEMFFTRSVPALAAMAENHDYKHFVMYSGLLPQRHQEVLRLKITTTNTSFCIPAFCRSVIRRCCSRPPQSIRSLCRWNGMTSSGEQASTK